MNYNLTRQEVAKILDISTRSVDRYIRSGKLRSKKKWKIVFINQNDVENLKLGNNKNHEFIISKKPQIIDNNTSRNNNLEIYWGLQNVTLDMIYEDLRDEIKRKDEIIQQISIKLWKSEEITKNSVSLVEFKKSQFLLEESKWHLNNEVQKLKEEKKDLEKDLGYKKTTNLVLIIFMLILLIFCFILWFFGV